MSTVTVPVQRISFNMNEQIISNEIGTTLMSLYQLLYNVADGKLSWTVDHGAYTVVWTQNKMKTKEVCYIWSAGGSVKIRLTYIHCRMDETLHVGLTNHELYDHDVHALVFHVVGSHLSAFSKELKKQYVRPSYEIIEPFCCELQLLLAMNLKNHVAHIGNDKMKLDISQDEQFASLLNKNGNQSYKAYLYKVYGDDDSSIVCRVAIKILTLARLECIIMFNPYYKAMQSKGNKCAIVTGSPENVAAMLVPVIYDWTRSVIKYSESVHAVRLKMLVDSFFKNE
jgi:hypothetical protein